MNLPLLSRAQILKSLIQDVVHREVECQAFLEEANVLLAPPLSKVVQVVREQVAMAGRSDYFILCEVNEVDVRKRLVLWEAKAPQLAPFEVSTQNRLMPSQALVEAENQLLYYFDEYRGNTQFLDRYQIRHPDDIKLGGIIIGSDNNWVRRKAGNTMSNEVLRQMAASAVRIRDEHFYRGLLKIVTWDRIVSVLDVPPVQK